jgi:hypothetical protein
MNALLLLDDGWAAERVAEALFIDAETVRDHRRLYETSGVVGVERLNYEGSDPQDHKVLFQAAANGQRVVEFTPDILQWSTSIPAGGNFMSPVVPSLNYPKAFYSAVSSQGGSLIVSRYADKGGTIKIDDTTRGDDRVGRRVGHT